MRVTRPLAVSTSALALLFAVPSLGAVQHGDAAITCVNRASGASWQIKIDYDHSTVDSNPASISDTEIKWRDAKDGWRYTLDLKSGDLTVVLASSTGGNMYFHRCMLDR